MSHLLRVDESTWKILRRFPSLLAMLSWCPPSQGHPTQFIHHTARLRTCCTMLHLHVAARAPCEALEGISGSHQKMEIKKGL